MIIGDVDLVYVTSSRAMSHFKICLSNISSKEIVPVLNVNQATIFDIDQVGSLSTFPFVYKYLWPSAGSIFYKCERVRISSFIYIYKGKGLENFTDKYSSRETKRGLLNFILL